MVSTALWTEQILGTCRQWLEKHAERCDASFAEQEFEHVVKVLPRNGRACPFELRIAKYDDAFDIGLGRAVFFEDVRGTPELLLQILEAIAHGNVTETIVERGDRLVSSRGEVRLRQDKVWHTRRSNLPGLFLKALFGAVTREVRYEPF